MIIEINQLETIRRNHALASVGYTSGVFDLFHRGHRNYLNACKKKCDILVIGVDSDCLARRRKGSPRPIQSITLRMINVNDNAHYVFMKDSASEQYTKEFHPDFYFFSDENLIAPEKLRKISGDPNFKDAVFIPYTTDISTTNILKG